MNVQQFLHADATQRKRHALVNGKVVAVAGSEDRHVTAALNVAMARCTSIGGSPCRTCMGDTELQVTTRYSGCYPDVMFTCSAADHANKPVKSGPMLLVEVLSPSTAGYDRGEKFAHYRHRPTVQEYVPGQAMVLAPAFRWDVAMVRRRTA